MKVSEMMYGGEWESSDSRLYRLERGFPYTRAGVIVPPIPKFKGLYIYSQAAGKVPRNFRQTMTSTRVRWPIPTVPAIPVNENAT